MLRWIAVAGLLLSSSSCGALERRDSVCRACGARLEETAGFGWTRSARTHETPTSRWVLDLHPEHVEHLWDLEHVRSGAMIRCSEPDHTADELYRLHSRDPSLAAERLDEFLAACAADDEVALATSRARISAAEQKP